MPQVAAAAAAAAWNAAAAYVASITVQQVATMALLAVASEVAYDEELEWSTAGSPDDVAESQRLLAALTLPQLAPIPDHHIGPFLMAGRCLEPHISSGDCCFVDPIRFPKSGELCLVEYGEDVLKAFPGEPRLGVKLFAEIAGEAFLVQGSGRFPARFAKILGTVSHVDGPEAYLRWTENMAALGYTLDVRGDVVVRNGELEIAPVA